MTRKHFEIIAGTIRATLEQAKTLPARTAIKEVALSLAGDFCTINPHFDRERFLIACGM